jgi:hypothetical protein
MEQAEKQGQDPHIIRYTVQFEIWSDQEKEKRITTYIVSDFIEKTPLMARQRAINYFNRVNKILLTLERKGILGYIENYNYHEFPKGGFSYAIFFRDCFYMDHDMELTDNNSRDIKEHLLFEYQYYLDHGFETGELQVKKDVDGKEFKFLPFD